MCNLVLNARNGVAKQNYTLEFVVYLFKKKKLDYTPVNPAIGPYNCVLLISQNANY